METTRARRGGGWKRCPIPTTGKVGISIWMPHISILSIFVCPIYQQSILFLPHILHFKQNLYWRTTFRCDCGHFSKKFVVREIYGRELSKKKWEQTIWKKMKNTPIWKNIPQSPEECTKLRHSANQNINSRTRIVNGVQVL